MQGEHREKTHMDYAYDLDLVIKPESQVPVIGREFGYYSGAGIPLFALGGGVYRSILSYILMKFHALRGYYLVETPILASSNLFGLSGHIEFYRKNMFLLDIEGHEYAIKPMNCPYHILVFMHEIARYRNKVPLPFKVFELGRVHRYEPSGSLYGLLRVRAFTQDDAHIITPGEKAVDSIYSVFEEMKSLYENLYSLPVNRDTVRLRLSFSDPQLIGTEFMGDPGEWSEAEEMLTKAADRIKADHGIDYSIEKGEAAFYGPKIDVIMTIEEAGITKEWQIGTIQFDFNLPRRFKLYDLVREVYGERSLFIIHRALQGSLERFLGVYLEYSKGRLPFVLAPIQVAVVAIKTGGDIDERILGFATALTDNLHRLGLRTALVEADKTGLSGVVRKIESTVKPPIHVYIGAREVEKGTLSIRVYDYAKRRHSTKTLEAPTPSDGAESLDEVARSLEDGVYKLIGEAPRVPVNLSHII